MLSRWERDREIAPDENKGKVKGKKICRYFRLC